MKKIIYLFIALTVLGGIVFALTQTSLLKGRFGTGEGGTETEGSAGIDDDGDGLRKSDEGDLGTDPNDSDSDDDGLMDGAEVTGFGTDPLNPDSDGDGVNDGEEVSSGSDPLDRSATSSTTTSTSTTSSIVCTALTVSPASYEIPANTAEVNFDLTALTTFDLDAWTDSEAFEATLVFESDGAGAFHGNSLSNPDGSVTSFTESGPINPYKVALTQSGSVANINFSGGKEGENITVSINEDPSCSTKFTLTQVTEAAPTEPTEPTEPAPTEPDPNLDTDGDGLTDAEEVDTVTDPNNSDTDGDTYSDGTEVDSGTDPLDATSYPGSSTTTGTTTTTEPTTTTTEPTTTTSDGSSSSDSTSSSSSSGSSTTSTTTESSTTTTTTETTTTINDILTSKEAVCSEPFTDVDSTHWSYSNVCRLYQAGIVNGRDANSFVPEGDLTRAEAIKILMLLSGKTEEDAEGLPEEFIDVKSSEWFHPWYVLAQEAGVVRVIDNGGYANPNAYITRGDFMLYMVRTAEQTLWDWEEEDIPFSDLKASDPYTYAIIIGYNKMVEDPDEGTTRVFEGYSNGTAGATKSIARSEAVALALRFYLAWYAQ
ncbi:MAG: S-layer homology domain-containing protein [Candidatus Gracilibacteria bacterium]|jgi:hypothetical protein